MVQRVIGRGDIIEHFSNEFAFLALTVIGFNLFLIVHVLFKGIILTLEELRKSEESDGLSRMSILKRTANGCRPWLQFSCILASTDFPAHLLS